MCFVILTRAVGCWTIGFLSWCDDDGRSPRGKPTPSKRRRWVTRARSTRLRALAAGWGEAAEGARKRTVTIMYELASCVPRGREGGVCMIYYYYNIIVYRKSTIRVKWRFLLSIFFSHFLFLHGLCASWCYRWTVGRKRVLNWGKKWKTLLVYVRVYEIHESRAGQRETWLKNDISIGWRTVFFFYR